MDLNDKERILRDIEERGGKNYVGRKYLIAHLEGKPLSPMQRIHAQCYECQGYCADGRPECGREVCPNFPVSKFNPHRKKRAARPGQKPPLRRQTIEQTAAD